MAYKTWISFLSLQLSFLAIPSQAIALSIHDEPTVGLYAGVMGGYGSTTWNGLVPEWHQQNLAMNLITPVGVTDDKKTWGLFVGFEFMPTFALEANYINYGDATVHFDPISLFAFNHNELTEFTSKTESANIMAKIFLTFPNSKIRFYSGIGLAGVHRKDMLAINWHTSPAFSVGTTYPLTKRIRIDLDGNFTVGYGEARLSPTETYIPFLYSAGVRLAWIV